MADFVSALGAELESKNGKVSTAEALEGKRHVMLYFSAHWCPPCRGFTPVLASKFKASAEEKQIAVVFVSSDRDEPAFDEYFAEMPWLALPYADRDAKNDLSKSFA